MTRHARRAGPALPPPPAITLLALALSTAGVPAAAQTPDQEWASTRYELTLLDDGSDAWQLAAVEVGSRRARLTPIARLSYASRFGGESYQVEGDLYPAWPGTGYAYLSAGWSPGAPFPDLRLAAEGFAVLPRGFEISAGLAHLAFGETDIPILVGSLSKYVGRYWLSLRPYWLPQDDQLSMAAIGRRYLSEEADEFVTLRLLYGTAPETLETAADVQRLESLNLHADARLRIARRWLVLPLAAVTSEELPNRRGRLRTSLGIGAMYVF